MCRPKKVRCFKCYKWFNKEKGNIKQCDKCGDFNCPTCNACLCSLSKKEQKIVMAMIYTYEKFIKEELKISQSYNFSQHKEIEKSINSRSSEK